MSFMGVRVSLTGWGVKWVLRELEWVEQGGLQVTIHTNILLTQWRTRTCTWPRTASPWRRGCATPSTSTLPSRPASTAGWSKVGETCVEGGGGRRPSLALESKNKSFETKSGQYQNRSSSLNQAVLFFFFSLTLMHIRFFPSTFNAGWWCLVVRPGVTHVVVHEIFKVRTWSWPLWWTTTTTGRRTAGASSPWSLGGTSSSSGWGSRSEGRRTLVRKVCSRTLPD